MSARAKVPRAVTGLLDADCRLIEADAPLAALHRRAGGKEGDMLAVPQIAALARLSRRLGIPIARGALAADGDGDLALWVRAEPRGDHVALAIDDWAPSAPAVPSALDSGRDADIARAAADWAWEADEALRLTQVPAIAAGLCGRTADDLAGQPLTALFQLVERADGGMPILEALAARAGFEGQPAKLRGGDGRTYRLRGVPLIDGEGNLAGFRGDAAADVPAVAEAAVEQSAAAALRAPIEAILGHAAALGGAGEAPLRDAYAGYAADIAAAGRHLLALVDDLADLDAVERPGFVPAAEHVDLAALAHQAAALLAVRAAEKGVDIVAPDMPVPATGDSRRILQILINLLANALRYAPEGSAVTIEAGDAALTVVDRGRGIAPADQGRVFEKFARVDPSEPGGTGLGLYIARRLARAMDGDLSLASDAGKGARFTLRLPPR